jgi:hypothetical protein
MPDTNRPSPSESAFFRKLGEVRLKQEACSPDAVCRNVDELVATARHSNSHAKIISTCEYLGEIVKELYRAHNPSQAYEKVVEHLAYQQLLHDHDIPPEELEEVKGVIDRLALEAVVT